MAATMAVITENMRNTDNLNKYTPLESLKDVERSENAEKLRQKKIAVVGIGYVGLSVAVLLAQHHQVYLLDIVQQKADMINRKESPIDDPKIVEYLKNEKLNLTATVIPTEAYSKADFVIVAVPTDFSSRLNRFDTSAVESVIQSVLQVESKAVIVIKSTVPVGYSESLAKKLKKKELLFSPEFLREGHALHDNLYPSRIVVGTDRNDPSLIETANEFAELLKEGACKKDAEVVITGRTEAEAAKLFANTYLAMRVAFFNELDTFAELRNLDTREIIRVVSLDPRIGNYYNNPSFGYGGYCLPKDSGQLLSDYAGIPEQLIESTVKSNEVRMDHVTERIILRSNTLCPDNQPVVGAYRLNMKAGSDNFRKSAMREVITRLRKKGIAVLIYEPLLKNGQIFENCPVVNSLEEFKARSTVIIANRNSRDLDDVAEKLYTRDIFMRD